MSKKIDERVVEMQFNNKQFERNVSTTMSTLDKLKQKLKLDGASKGLENVQTAASKVNFSPLTSAVEAVGVKFNGLYTIADQALRNITNSAMQAGKQIVSAFTIDPIKTGFQEYETQINAVQTILANTQSKGSTLTDVNAALDELNKYADQTIYNFTEMTRNIGTFTAAGVDLDKSVTSIKGIANLAAVSGSNATQASTAMYQLSQALAAGKVSLMDWNSVVNAGMGGQVFQDALKRTAENFGYNVDGMIKKYGSFRESLTEGGWLTAEVLTETLTQLSGAYTEADLIAQGYSAQQAKDIVELANTAVDAATKVKTFTQLWDTLKEAAQSGWTQTWEILVGDFEEAKDFLTELSELFGGIINQSAEARNALLYDAMTSNWKKITDGITEAGISAEDFKDKVTEIAKANGVDVDALVEEYGSLEAAFKNGAISSEYLDKALTAMTGTSEEITKKMKDLDLGLENSATNIKKLTDAGVDYVDAKELVTKGIDEQVKALSELSDEQLLSIGYTAEQVEAIRELPKQLDLANGSLKEFMDNVSQQQGREMILDAIRVSLRSLVSVCEAVGKAWRDVFPPTTSDQLLSIVESIKNFALALRPTEETLDKITRTFRGFFSILSIAKTILGQILSPIGELVGQFGDLGGGILDVTASFGDWLVALDQSIKAGETFSFIGDGIATVLEWIFDGVDIVSGGFNSMGDVLSSVGKVISDAFGKAFDVAKNVVDWIGDNITAGDIFAGLAGGGIFVLAKKLGDFIDKIKDILGFGDDGDKGPGIKDTFVEVLGSVHDSLESFQQGIQVASLIGIAAAIMLLTSSLKKISEIEPVEIAYSLATIRLMIASLNSGFKGLTKTLTSFKPKGAITAALAMIAMAEAVNILGDAMLKVSDLDWDEIAKGLVTVGVLMLELGGAIKIIGSSGGVNLRTSVAILALAQACKMLSEALAGFSDMSWDEIARGLTAMGVALLELSGALAILSKAGGFGALLGSVGVLISSLALDEISENLERLGQMSWEEIGKGLTAMSGALLVFTSCLAILSQAGGFGSLLGGTAILVAAQSLDEISENLERMGSMSWEEIGRGLTAMGGTMLIFMSVLGTLSSIGGFGSVLGAAAVLITSKSLDEIAENLQEFADMTWGEIGRGLTAMGGALLIVGGMSGALGKIAGLSGIIGAGTILIAVQGLDDLATALQKFGTMSWEEIGRGLSAMGAAMAEVAVVSGALGWVGGVAGLVGAGTLTLAISGLNDLADALIKFGSMSWEEIGRGLSAMGAAMAETAIGGIINTFSGFGAVNISKIVDPLSDLADSVKKWADVYVPEDLGNQLKVLAEGVQAFTFGGWGADAIATFASPIGDLADSVKKWTGVVVPSGLGDNIASLAGGINAFNFSGWGADAISTFAFPLGVLADSVKKWTTVTVPEEIGDQLKSLAGGVQAFTFAGWGADSLSTAATGVGDMANAISKWEGITIPEGIGDGLKDIASGVQAFSFAIVGGWTIGSIKQPLIDFADAVIAWDGVTVPENIKDDLTNLADGVKAFNWAFMGSWSIDSLIEPLANLAGSVTKWIGVNITGIGPQLTEFSTGLQNLKNVDIGKKFSDNFDAFFTTFASETVPVAATNIQSVVSGLRAMTYVDTEALANFGRTLSDLGNIGIDELVASFESGSERLGQAITSMITTIQSFLSNASSVVGANATNLGITMGTNIATGLQTGLSTMYGTVTSSIIAMSSFITAQSGNFQAAGRNLGIGVMNGVTSTSSTILSSFNTIVMTSLQSINAKAPSFNTSGKSLMTQFMNGVRSTQSTTVNTFSKIIAEVLSMIKSRYPQFLNSGKDLMTNIVNGVNSISNNLVNAFSNSISSSTDTIRSYYTNFYNAGAYLVEGFGRGIDDNAWSVADKAARMARDAYDAAMRELDAHSPSRVFMKVGSYVALGFANGISDNSSAVESSATSMADAAIENTKNAISKIADAINSDIDVQPTIRPVLDLSDVEKGAGQLNTLFSQSQAAAVSSSILARRTAETIQNGSSDGVSSFNPNFSFVQNNYSPKALSEIEIYRQTNNLFSSMIRRVRV